MCGKSRLAAGAPPNIPLMFANSYGCRADALRVTARFKLSQCLTGALLLPALASASTLRVQVSDRNGDPVQDAVIYASPAETTSAASSGTTAVMNQIHQEFQPHILVVQRGTLISFPNNDTVRHHVYSFSNPKPFELSLYAGMEHPPLEFDKPGVVVLGCNIHDNMLAYILVVDTPYYAKSDARGVASITEIPRGDYTLSVWTPRLRADDLPPPQTLAVGEGDDANAAVRLEHRLFPAHETDKGTLTWSAY